MAELAGHCLGYSQRRQTLELEAQPQNGSVAVALSPRENLAATIVPGGQIRIWDVLHGEERLRFAWRPNKDGGKQLDIAAAAFAPSGLTLAVAGVQPPRNDLKLFETSTGQQRLHVDLAGALQPDLGEVPALVLAQRLVTKAAYSGARRLAPSGLLTRDVYALAERNPPSVKCGSRSASGISFEQPASSEFGCSAKFLLKELLGRQFRQICGAATGRSLAGRTDWWSFTD